MSATSFAVPTAIPAIFGSLCNFGNLPLFRFGNDLNLKNTRPQFAGDKQALLRRIISDAVQHRALLQFVHGAEKAGQVDPPNHFAGLRRDPRDTIRLPYVGQNLSFEKLELVEFGDRRAAVTDLKATFFAERAPVKNPDRGRAIAHEKICSIGRQAPAFAGVRKAAEQMKVARVVDESNL